MKENDGGGEDLDVFATQARVDSIKEDVDALGRTGSKLLEGQERLENRVKRLEQGQQRLEARVGQLDTKVGQLDTKVDGLDTWVRTNLRAVMGHLGVPEVEAGSDQR